MRQACVLVATAALLVTTGCSGQRDLVDPPGRVVSASEGVRVIVDGERIVVANDGIEPVRFGAVEREFFDHALASWCFGFGECGTLVAAGRTASVRLADVAGYQSGAREIVLFWWPERPHASDAEKASALRRVSVAL